MASLESRFPARLTWWLVLLLATALSTGAYAQQRGVEQDPDEADWMRGYHGFNLICAGLGLEHCSVGEWDSVDAKDAILVVFGKARINNIKSFINRGGAVLIACDQSSPSLRSLGIDFVRLNSVYGIPMNPEDRFQGFSDCPIISAFNDPDHPVLKNVDRLIANRPSVLTQHYEASGFDSEILASFAPTMSRATPPFLICLESRANGKLLCVADQSIFANQMMMHGDNALFTKQAISWLKGSDRTKVLVWSEGEVRYPVPLNDVEVNLPPPTRQEVIEALKNLPPSMLLEFGNDIAAILEDEDMVNEFLTSATDRIRPKAMNRALIFLTFAMAFVFTCFVFQNQKRLRRRTASNIATELSWAKKRTDRVQERQERQSAVEALLDSFCQTVAGRRYHSWVDFPNGLEVRESRDASRMLESMHHVNSLVNRKPASYWTQKRVLNIEHEIDLWREHFGVPPQRVEAACALADEAAVEAEVVS